MKHLGDITKISGYTAPIVDCVVGGSPCQDLSIAGKRAGLDGERSGLFMEQVRIVKEMRDRDVRVNGRTGVDVRPRYLVWENVPGAFSSNKGEDFRIVLEEIAKIADENAVIPRPDKWQTSGCILGDGWSIAWRVLDAQFYGVPQRRRRIALVADFGGESAPEILFIRKSVSGHSQPSESERKAVAHNAEGSIGANDKAYTMKIRSGCDVDANGKSAGKGALIQTEQSGTLSCVQDQYLFQPVGFDAYNQAVTGGVAKSLTAIKSDTDHTPVVVQPLGADQYNAVILGDSVSTLGVNCGMSHGRQCVLEPVVYSKSRRASSSTDYETWKESGISNTLNTFDTTCVRTNEAVVALDRAAYNQGKNAQFDFDCNDGGIASTIVAKGPGAVCYTVDQGAGKSSVSVLDGASPTLACTHDGAPAVCYSLDPASSNSMKSSNPHSGCHVTDVARTIDTTYPDPSKNQGGVAVVETASCYAMQGIGEYKQSEVGSAVKQRDYKDATDLVCSGRTRYTVRRLTPCECEALQGFPKNWTDIGEWTDSKGKKRKTSDANRYKALGNSIAIPPWKWVMKRLCACYERDATLASLFDGIGGFPYIWEQINGKGSCLWASEIEEFPIAVTKVRIGE